MSDPSNLADDLDDNPYADGRTSRGTYRVLISVELKLNDELSLIAGMQDFEGVSDPADQELLKVQAALVDSIGQRLSSAWPAVGRPVGLTQVMCSPIVSAYNGGERSDAHSGML